MARHFGPSTVVNVGSLLFGGDHPVRIQTMWKEPIHEESLSETARKIELMASYGCELLRFAVPDEDSAHILCRLQTLVSIPLVADIHFNHKLADRSLFVKGKVHEVRFVTEDDLTPVGGCGSGCGCSSKNETQSEASDLSTGMVHEHVYEEDCPTCGNPPELRGTGQGNCGCS